LNGFEGRLIDDGRNFVFDNPGSRLAFAVALSGKFIEVADTGAGTTREYFVNRSCPA